MADSSWMAAHYHIFLAFCSEQDEAQCALHELKTGMLLSLLICRILFANGACRENEMLLYC